MGCFSEFYTRNEPVLSLEFFPPKKPEDLSSTLEMIRELSSCAPDFMTITYGSGGGTRELTQEIASYVHNSLHIPAVAHLSCVQLNVSEIDRLLDSLKKEGITKILALRGDPSKGDTHFKKPLGGFGCARDLVRHIRQRGDFSIAVAGYPETHRDAKSAEDDLGYLKEKVDAGAEVVFTQLFFESQVYFDFIKRARAFNIAVPIVPGVMPISNVGQLKRFTSLCGASIPPLLASRLSELENEPDAVTQFGISYATNLAKELLTGGAPGIHLYTLNRSTQVPEIIRNLKIDRMLRS